VTPPSATGYTYRWRVFTALVLLIGSAAPAVGQDPTVDSTRVADSTGVADSTAQLPTDTAPPRLRTLPIPPIEIPSGPLPPGSRHVFTRDSIAWNPWYTVADLLGTIPGVYVARGGFVGQPQPVTFAGRGPTAIQIFWDGVEMLPIGPDSVSVDPGRISLFPFRRVEVEVLPALLRVYLVSERHETPSTRSTVRIVSGDFSTGAYAGLFQHRWPSGVGLNLGVDFLSNKGARDIQRDATWFDLWGKLEWTPTPLSSATIQLRQQKYDREPTTPEGTIGIPGREGNRTDVLVRILAATRPDRYGLWVDGGIATSVWSPDSGSPDSLVIPRTFRRAFAGLGVRGRRASAEIRARIGDHFTTSAAEARLGWVPIGGIVLSADGSAQRHRGDRRSYRGHAAAGLYIGPLSVTGDVAMQDAVPAPALPTDTARRTTDFAVRAGLDTRLLSGRVGLVRRDAFDPLPFTGFLGTTLGPTGETRFVEANAILRLGAWSLNGWYSNPTSGIVPDFQPPTHGRAALTLRSKFLPTFRSGAFDLKVQIAMESWSRGVAGRDADGAPVELAPATFWEGFLQFEIAGFRAFYSLKNAYNSREQFVPGLEYPRNIQTFGIKWTFSN